MEWLWGVPAGAIMEHVKWVHREGAQHDPAERGTEFLCILRGWLSGERLRATPSLASANTTKVLPISWWPASPNRIGKSPGAALGHGAVGQGGGVDAVSTSCAALDEKPERCASCRCVHAQAGTLAHVGRLLIDDFGPKLQRVPADADRHNLIAERYEQAANVLTSILGFDT